MTSVAWVMSALFRYIALNSISRRTFRLFFLNSKFCLSGWNLSLIFWLLKKKLKEITLFYCPKRRFLFYIFKYPCGAIKYSFRLPTHLCFTEHCIRKWYFKPYNPFIISFQCDNHLTNQLVNLSANES